MRAVIIGSGISGLSAAIALAHDGHDAVVLERDATPLPDSADEAFEWNRRGAPQVRHSHAFLARGRNTLRDRFPHVREALLAAGVTEVAWADMLPDTITDKTPAPGDEDLVMLASRRTTFEWVLRRSALETERVEIRDGVTVTGLDANGSRVTGVTTSAETIDADFVVDAAGRPSHLIQMLAGVGIKLRETKSASGIVYLSRFYRLHDGVKEPTQQPFDGADVGYLKFAIFRGDNRTFSVTLAYDTEDEPLRSLRRRGRFDEAIDLMPPIAVWVDPDVSEPISGVHYMGGLINRVRHFVVDGRPIVRGLFAVGDSSVCTNPLYGRGCSLGLVHGTLLADAIRADGEDPDAVALAFDAATNEHLVPWYDAAVAQDKVNMQIARGEELSDFDAYVRSLVNDGLFPAARFDANTSRAWYRTFNLLRPPQALMSDPDVMRVALEYWNERENREPEPLRGPTREEFFHKLDG
jgi:2-polyprenyl-6-methoxyphenol hydroxylase-like FAD-dependent oxidoreductase